MKDELALLPNTPTRTRATAGKTTTIELSKNHRHRHYLACADPTMASLSFSLGSIKVYLQGPRTHVELDDRTTGQFIDDIREVKHRTHTGTYPLLFYFIFLFQPSI